jgi:hypothetical protein
MTTRTLVVAASALTLAVGSAHAGVTLKLQAPDGQVCMITANDETWSALQHATPAQADAIVRPLTLTQCPAAFRDAVPPPPATAATAATPTPADLVAVLTSRDGLLKVIGAGAVAVIITWPIRAWKRRRFNRKVEAEVAKRLRDTTAA